MSRKFEKGKFSISSDKGSLRISFPKRLRDALKDKGFSVKPYIYTGLSDSPTNKALVQQVIDVMNHDAQNLHSSFDGSLKKYMNMLKPQIDGETNCGITIGEVWDDWLAVKQTQLKKSTLKVTYQRLYSNLLAPFRDLSVDARMAKKVVENLKFCSNIQAASGLLVQLKLAVGYQIDNGILVTNPFSPYKLKPPKKVKVEVEEDRRAFSLEDREKIIKAFYQHPGCSDYAQLVEFIFLTGCRPSEAYALTWSDIRIGKYISFNKSLSSVTKEKQTTKTDTPRRFILCSNDRLNNLLASMDKGESRELLFSSNDKPINHDNLYSRWGRNRNKKRYPAIVLNLANKGEIFQYLPIYSMRHTYITLMANKLYQEYDKAYFLTGMKMLANCVGNSVSTIMEHYLNVAIDMTYPTV